MGSMNNMTGFTKLYVDDLRPLPDNYGSEWTIARTAWEALLKLELIEFEEVSLDNDLASFVGNIEITGYDILNWMVQRKVDGLYVPPNVFVHSANCVAVPKMQETIDRWWK